MQVYSDRFETVLPKQHFYSPPKTAAPAQPIFLGYLLVGVLLGVIFTALTRNHQEAPVFKAPVATAPALPDAPPVPRAMPVLATGTVPRAQLVHVRPIGTVENDRMPDGRVLTTRYRGELPSATRLPTYGAQLGDMWYTQNDGHCWVLAPIGAGSSTVGWVDP